MESHHQASKATNAAYALVPLPIDWEVVLAPQDVVVPHLK
jgi:hypothetical protein